jgi:Mg2+ and Co2+ transporter CorA
MTTYYADIKDNVTRVIDSMESYKEMCESLMNHHLESQNTKTNEIVRTLTVGKVAV